jgi:hypothetical protein
MTINRVLTVFAVILAALTLPVRAVELKPLAELGDKSVAASQAITIETYTRCIAAYQVLAVIAQKAPNAAGQVAALKDVSKTFLLMTEAFVAEHGLSATRESILKDASGMSFGYMDVINKDFRATGNFMQGMFKEDVDICKALAPVRRPKDPYEADYPTWPLQLD